jgi:hypothetical protein
MKKFTFLFLTLALTLFSSCKEKKHPVGAITSPEPDVCDAYDYSPEDFRKIEKNLNLIALCLNEAAKDEKVIEIVNELVSKRFDGDDNVLIKELVETCEKRGIGISRIFVYISVKVYHSFRSKVYHFRDELMVVQK